MADKKPLINIIGIIHNTRAASDIMLVIIPLMMARIIIMIVGKENNEYWKNKIVPKSPMLQPNKHHNVLFALVFHVFLQYQSKVSLLNDLFIFTILLFKFHSWKFIFRYNDIH